MNKNILIAGASRGLGYSLTLQYLKENFTVYAGTRNLEKFLFYPFNFCNILIR